MRRISWLALSGFPPPNVRSLMVTAKVKETSISFPFLKTYDELTWYSVSPRPPAPNFSAAASMNSLSVSALNDVIAAPRFCSFWNIAPRREKLAGGSFLQCGRAPNCKWYGPRTAPKGAFRLRSDYLVLDREDSTGRAIAGTPRSNEARALNCFQLEPNVWADLYFRLENR